MPGISFEILSEIVAMGIAVAVARNLQSRQRTELACGEQSEAVISVTPHVANTVASLNDDEWKAGPAQMVACGKTGLARPDDEDVPIHHTTTTRVPMGVSS